jgi:hypothetical protein
MELTLACRLYSENQLSAKDEKRCVLVRSCAPKGYRAIKIQARPELQAMLNALINEVIAARC